jgi:hypothetical protein
MAKPDLQQVYANTATGDLMRLKGKLGLGEALDFLVGATGDVDAAASGVPLRGLYYDSDTNPGMLRVRLS